MATTKAATRLLRVLAHRPFADSDIFAFTDRNGFCYTHWMLTFLLVLLAIPVALWASVWVFSVLAWALATSFTRFIDVLIRTGVMIPREGPSQGPRH